MGQAHMLTPSTWVGLKAHIQKKGMAPWLPRVAVAGQIPTAVGNEVQQGVVGEQAGRATDRTWGSREELAHQMGLSMAEWIDGEGKATGSQSGGHRCSWNGQRGDPGLGESCHGGTLPEGES
jgi:hypothetical protein